MPLNKKGKKILKSMKEQYGSDAEKVFYASKNKGTIKNVEKKMGGGLSGGKRSGPPPEKGPDSQGLKIQKMMFGNFAKGSGVAQPVSGGSTSGSGFGGMGLMGKLIRQNPQMFKNSLEEEEEKKLLKKGGMSCPYRRGGKTSIQGVSKIQVKGQKFTGVK